MRHNNTKKLQVRKRIEQSTKENRIVSATSDIKKSIYATEENVYQQNLISRWNVINKKEPSILASYRPHCRICEFEGTRNEFKILMAKDIFFAGELERYLCPRCGVIFGPRKVMEMTDSELAQDYGDLYHCYNEVENHTNEIRAFHLLKPTKTGVYVNYGCGKWSQTFEILKADGYQVYGYDPFVPNPCAHVITKPSQLVAMQVDGIFSNNLFEHLKDPVNDLLFMKSALKPGGRLAHATPCYEYLYDHTHYHLFFYTGDSMKWIAKRLDMIIEEESIKDSEFMCQVLKRKD